MLTQLIKWTTFFQLLLSSQFRTLKQDIVHTLVFLSTCHLFAGLPPVFNSTYFVYFSLVVVRKRFVC